MSRRNDISIADLDRAAGLVEEIRGAARAVVEQIGISRAEAHRMVTKGGVRISLSWLQLMITDENKPPEAEPGPEARRGRFLLWFMALLRPRAARQRPAARGRRHSGEAVIRIAKVMAAEAESAGQGKRIRALIKEYDAIMSRVAAFVRRELGPASSYRTASEAARIFALPASSLAPLYLEETRERRKKAEWAVRGKSAAALREFARTVLLQKEETGEGGNIANRESESDEPPGLIASIFQRLTFRIAPPARSRAFVQNDALAAGHSLMPEPLANSP